MAENKYTKSIEEIKVAIRQIVAEMEIVDKKITSTGNKLASFSKGLGATTPNEFKKQADQITKLQRKIEEFSKKQSDLDTKLHDEKRKKELEYSRLFDREQKKREAAVNREANVRKSLNAQRDRELRSLGQLGTAYERLGAKLNIAKNKYRDLLASQTASRKEIKMAEAEFRKYQNRMNQVNKATSNFSKNSLGGMVRGFRNLLGAFGIIGGVTALVQFGKEIFSMVRKIESLNFALKTVTQTQEEFARVQTFLSDISTRYGVDLISITERYTKFLAAAKQSNLGLKETEQIFDSVTKASSVLGLKTDELTGVYLALEQMLSKGKVTTEELRRQLGERLPGAFGIMASALGVSVSKLDEMLKKGEILSSEALPKFAKELEKAYGIEAVETVDTLTAAQNRLTTAWIEFVESLESGEGRISTIFKTLFSGLTDFVDGLNLFNETGFDVAEKLVAEFKLSSRSSTEEVKNFIVNSLQATDKAIQSSRKEFENLLDSPLIRQAKDGKLFFLGVGQSEDFERAKFLQEEINRQVEIRTGLTKELNNEQKRREALIQKAIELSTQYSKQKGHEINLENQIKEINSLTTLEVEKRIAFLAKQVHVEEEVSEGQRKGIEALKGSIAFMEQYIKKLEEQRSKLAVNTEGYREYTKEIENANAELLRLIATLSNPKVDTKIQGTVDIDGLDAMDTTSLLGGFDLSKDVDKFTLGNLIREDAREGLEATMDAADEAAEYLKKKRIGQYWMDQQDIQNTDQIVKTLFDSFSEYYDIDLQKFEFLYDKKENTTEQWADASKELINAALEASLQRYDIELQEAQRANELIQNNELATEKEKRIARQRFEREERRIKTERAKAERKNTLIAIAVDTAAAVAKALAQTGVLAPAFIPTIIGVGLAQAALVAAQPLPKFAEGTKAPLSEDTLAIVGDGGKKEAITENGKLVGVTPDKPTLMSLKKGQEVQKDAKDWINNAVYRMNMESNGEMLSSVVMDNIMHDEMRKMRMENKRTWEEVKRLAERPIHVNNKVFVESKYDEYKL